MSLPRVAFLAFSFVTLMACGTAARAAQVSDYRDTAPAWSADGRSIVFTSNRGGTDQLYRVALEDGVWSGSPRETR